MNMIFKAIYNKAYQYGVLVMFSHTIFSFSFALFSMLLASNGLPSIYTIFWIVIAFLAARTGANAINRVIDAEIDKKNPRTANRQIPKGEISKIEVVVFTIICFAIMVYAAYKLNTVCVILSPIALFLLTIYSYTKRFTWACHLILGITCAAAPVGAWIAIRGNISIVPLILGLANALWVAGFDIIYGAQDYDFDTKNNIKSIPAYFGVKNALNISKVFHVITILLLIFLLVLVSTLGYTYLIGVLIIAGLLIAEHLMVSPENLTNAKIASYSINQLVSIVFLIFTTLDLLIF